MEGWISLHRKLCEHWLWDEKPYDKARAWMDLLLHINHSSKKFLFDGMIIELERGQKITSIRKMADRWGWSRSKVSRFLGNLEKDGMLIVESDTKKTLLTVVNWETYQNVRTQRAAEKPQTSHRRTQTIMKNNDNNENNSSPEGKLLSWLKSDAPRVMKMTKPITLSQAKRILANYDRKVIADTFTGMENFKPLVGKYMDANMTFKKWASNAIERNAEKNPSKKGGTFKKPKTI